MSGVVLAIGGLGMASLAAGYVLLAAEVMNPHFPSILDTALDAFGLWLQTVNRLMAGWDATPRSVTSMGRVSGWGFLVGMVLLWKHGLGNMPSVAVDHWVMTAAQVSLSIAWMTFLVWAFRVGRNMLSRGGEQS